MKLGPMLKQARYRSGLTLREVAKRTGVSFARLCELENETGCNPRILTIHRLLTFYGLPQEDVLNAAVESSLSRSKP